MSIEHELQDANWTNELNRTSGAAMPVLFYTRQVPNEFKSKQEGRPMFDDKVFLKKLIPGDSTFTYDQPMRPGEDEQYPTEWARFQQKRSIESSGTPLALWPELTEGQRAEFRALNIFTIEQFANLPDSVGHKIMGLNHLRQQAKNFLSASRNAADNSRHEEMRGQIEQMRQENERLRSMVESIARRSASGPAKRGRPAKVKVQTEQEEMVA